jgi:hypothetical protein
MVGSSEHLTVAAFILSDMHLQLYPRCSYIKTDVDCSRLQPQSGTLLMSTLMMVVAAVRS